MALLKIFFLIGAAVNIFLGSLLIMYACQGYSAKKIKIALSISVIISFIFFFFCNALNPPL